MPPITMPKIIPICSAAVEESELETVILEEVTGRPSILLKLASPDDNEADASVTEPDVVVAVPSTITEPRFIV